MKKIIFLRILFLFFVSCLNNKNNDNHSTNFSKKTKNIDIKNNLIKIKISDEYFFYWDSKKDEIIEDNFFEQIKKNKNIIPIIINQIENLEIIEQNICSKKEKLLKGDLMYLLLEKLNIIQNFRCLKIQFDVFDENCKYPNALLDYIHHNRKKVIEQIKKCHQEF